LNTLNKPEGLKTVQVVTLLFSLVMGFFGLSNFLLFLLFHTLDFALLLLLVLAVAGFALAVLFHSGVKLVWYAANVYWVVCFVSIVYLGILGGATRNVWRDWDYLVYFLPIVYSVSCLLYFQTRQVKDYFALSNKPKS
jgi:hypothetical protein